MSMQHDKTRRSLARVAGLALMIWGIGWAVVWSLATVGVFAFALWAAMSQGRPLYFMLAAAALVVGLVLVAFGVGKAMAGWILVKKDQEL